MWHRGVGDRKPHYHGNKAHGPYRHGNGEVSRRVAPWTGGGSKSWLFPWR